MYTYESVMTKIGQRLNNSKKLTPYLTNMSDFSKMSMANRIAQTVTNLEDANKYMSQLNASEGVYSVDMSMRNFDASSRDFASAGAAVSGQEGVRGVDVVDITLIATVQSMIPTMAVDFGMAKPTDVITYQKLVAADSEKAGEDVVNPYKPIAGWATSSMNDADLTGVVGTGDAKTMDFGAPIAPGTVKITKDTTVGEDLKGDGVIYFLGASEFTSVSVDYETGIVTANAALTGWTGTAKADMSAEQDGAHTLKLVPRNAKITVDAVQHSVQLQNNIESISFMNKQIVGKNYGEMATRQMLDAFIYTLNAEVARKIVEVAKKESDLDTVKANALNLSAYYTTTSFTQFSITKDDLVMDYLNRLELAQLAKSDKSYTFIFCGNAAARVFMSNPKFKSIPQQLQKMDGVMGYLDLGYAQIAIVKHQVMQTLDDASYGYFAVGYKDPNGFAAPVGYFEYLPICSTKVALNWQNPTQFSQSVFNYSTSEELIPQYVALGAFKFTA